MATALKQGMQIHADITNPNLMPTAEISLETWRRYIESAWLAAKSAHTLDDAPLLGSDEDPVTDMSCAVSDADSGDESLSEWSHQATVERGLI